MARCVFPLSCETWPIFPTQAIVANDLLVWDKITLPQFSSLSTECSVLCVLFQMAWKMIFCFKFLKVVNLLTSSWNELCILQRDKFSILISLFLKMQRKVFHCSKYYQHGILILSAGIFTPAEKQRGIAYENRRAQAAGSWLKGWLMMPREFCMNGILCNQILL